MEIDSTGKITCRTCLSLNNRNDSILIYTVSDLVMSCSEIKISENDNLPSHICNSCHEKAIKAHAFRLLCNQSDVTLRAKLLRTSVVNLNDELQTATPPADDTFVSMSKIKMENNTDTEDEIGMKMPVEIKLEYDLDSKDDALSDTIEGNDSGEDHMNHVVVKVEDFEIKSFICKFCDKPFLYKKSYEKHLREHESPNISCEKCGKMFSTPRQLALHMYMHNRKGLHLCQTCGKQFTMPENLLKHVRIHTGEKRHKCELCNKAFVQSGELKSHLVTHSMDKPFLCNVCGNKFSRKISLRIHIRNIHSNSAQVYNCDVCGKGFKDKRDLRRHRIIHTGERDHVCKVCKKAFNRKSILIVHERIHNGHRPHVCPVCKRGFIQKHVLITHMQRIHPVQ